MGILESNYAIALAVTAVAAAAIFITVIRLAVKNRRSGDEGDGNGLIARLEAELAAIRDAKSDLDQRLMTAEERENSRVYKLEEALAAMSSQTDALRQEKASAERALAAASEGLSQLPGTLARAESRTASLDGDLKTALQRLESLRIEKSKSDEALAARTEALARVEAQAQALGARLDEALGTLQGMVEQGDALKEEKSRLEEKLAVAAEIVVHREAMLEDLRLRLDDAAKSGQEVAARLEAATDEKNSLDMAVTEKAAHLEDRVRLAKETRAELDRTNAALDAARKEHADLYAQHLALQESMELITKHSEEKFSILQASQVQKAEELKTLAAEAVQQFGEVFTKQNAERVSEIFKPLHEDLVEFHEGFTVAYAENAKERSNLVDQLRALMASSAMTEIGTSDRTAAALQAPRPAAATALPKPQPQPQRPPAAAAPAPAAAKRPAAGPTPPGGKWWKV